MSEEKSSQPTPSDPLREHLEKLREHTASWSQLELWTYLLRSYVDPKDAADIARWIKSGS